MLLPESWTSWTSLGSLGPAPNGPIHCSPFCGEALSPRIGTHWHRLASNVIRTVIRGIEKHEVRLLTPDEHQDIDARDRLTHAQLPELGIRSKETQAALGAWGAQGSGTSIELQDNEARFPAVLPTSQDK